ncbi:MAG: HflC protein [Legionellales bacterium]|nr:HflC protein [Legionellales bacterium]|tara:strand:+ start:456 stop:1373 length:918 start_codon:yes stop_codon:yes gene_type:complete
MSANHTLKISGIIFLILISFSTFFTVQQGEKALVVRLGELTGSQNDDGGQIYLPGLNFKMPLIDHVLRFDARLQTFEQKSSRILTVEQKYVLVDYYVKWRIEDLPLYYKRTAARMSLAQMSSNGSIGALEELLGQKINNALRAEFGQHTISEVVSGERLNIMSKLQASANESAKNLGVKVIDVRIKRIDLPNEVSQSVFERMRADRERVATKHRANGRAEAEAISAKADAQRTVIEATALAEGAAIRAKGDAEAAKIYNDAYLKDESFYMLFRSLKAYVQTFNSKDLMVLSPESDYFKFFKGPRR